MKCFCVMNFREALVERDVPTPTPEGTQVLLRVRAAGVCHSDLHIWEGGYDLGNGKTLSLRDRGITPPLTMGHETVGNVVASGTEAEGLNPDSNYLVYPWIGCGNCPACQAGLENHCSSPQYLGVYRAGGYADHILVPHPRYLIDIGKLDPAQMAPYACSGLTTYAALKKVGETTYTQHPVVIMGAGGLGLMCVQLLKALGGAGAIVVDIDPAKRQAALEAGALAAIDGKAPDALQQIMAANGGKPVQAVIDLVGAPATTSLGFDALIKGGKLIIIGLFGGQSTWSLALIPMKAAQIIGSYVGNLEELRELVDLVKTGKVQPIPTQTFPLDQADATLMALHSGKITGRAILTP